MPKLSKSEKKTLYGLLQKLVRLRDGERCLRCQKKESLHLSHIYPKGKYRRMEFEPENLKLLCVGCHLYWWHKNPIEAHEWLKTVIDKKRLERLRLQANTNDKSPFDYKLYRLWLEQEIKRFEDSRK